MGVANQSSFLQSGGDDAHGRALDTEHDRQKLVAQMEVLFMHSVVGHEQPTSAPLLHWMERVARGSLNNIGELHLCVSPNHVVQRTTCRQFMSKRFNDQFVLVGSR